MAYFALAFCGAAALLFAALLLFQRTLYASAMCLLMVLLQIGAMFFLCGAQLLGLLQVVIYAGAVMVLIVVAVMASPGRVETLWADLGSPTPVAAAVLGILAVELATALVAGLLGTGGGLHAVRPGLQTEMAALLFGAWSPVTEAVGVLVLVAALAVVVVDERRESL